jgi:hypothetical protein
MSLDFRQVREQVRQLGENARLRLESLQTKREQAFALLESNAQALDDLRQKVRRLVHDYDPYLRCALPFQEPLDAHQPLPQLPNQATLLAADGSQIAPDRHLEVNYCLINVGAIRMQLGAAQAPEVTIRSQLFYDEALYTETGVITEARLALLRDLNERSRLADLAEGTAPPVITVTDGPMELWGGREGGESESEFRKSMDAYREVLSRLRRMGAATAGYVDKPAANLVVRLLEVAMLAESQLPEIRRAFPLRGVIDAHLFRRILDAGERSAVFALQSGSAGDYRDELALHFFYLNVGRPGHPWLARVEIPAWVAADARMLDDLHAVLVQQCRLMGGRAYPYLLHRAHEAAVVTLQEKEQVTAMIAQELRRRGVEVGEVSHKQSAKDLPGRTGYERRGTHT